VPFPRQVYNDPMKRFHEGRVKVGKDRYELINKKYFYNDPMKRLTLA